MPNPTTVQFARYGRMMRVGKIMDVTIDLQKPVIEAGKENMLLIEV